MEELSKNELWAIYETLPESLKDTIFSEDTAEAIWDIAKINEINEVAKLSKLVSQVLIGLLPPQFIKDALKESLNLKEEKAKKIAIELEHYIFNQVKEELDELYEEITDKKNAQKKAQDQQKKITDSDRYREQIE
jgi:hypothetical protein